jgi:hypothetical protein
MTRMVSKLTVVAPAGHEGQGLVHLVESLDDQSLSYDLFEVFFLVEDLTSEVAGRLDELASRRPNVRVLPQPTGEDAVKQAAEQATGEWLLYLRPGLDELDAKLPPQALQRLGDFGESHDCDVVIGRVDLAAGRRAHDLFVRDNARLAGLDPAVLAEALVVLYRRAFALESGVARDLASAETVLAATDCVGALASYTSLVATPDDKNDAATPDDKNDADDASAGTTELVLTHATVRWDEQKLVVNVEGTVGEAGPGGEVHFSVRDALTGVEYWLPGRGNVGEDGQLTAEAEIDVRSAALGDRLPDGAWHVMVGVHRVGDGWTERRAVPATSAVGGLVEGLLVVPSAAGGDLIIDVGATESSVVPTISIEDISIVETATGTLLTVPLPDLAVVGSSKIEGFLHLGKFKLPAYLVANGQAQLECFLSGLAGTSVLATQFGRSRPAPTGLSLVISPIGAMSVIPTPKPAPAPATPAKKADAQAFADAPVKKSAPAKKAAATKKRAQPVSNPAAEKAFATRLRRRVPAPLEPAVRAVAQNSAARKVYRRLSHRSTLPR